MSLSRAQMTALLRQLEGPARQAFKNAIESARSRASLAALAKAIESGDVDAIMKAAGVREGMWTALNEQLRSSYVKAGMLTLASDLPRRLHLDFSITNPRAEQWLRNKSSEFVLTEYATQRSAIQEILQAGLARGDNPMTTALDIVGRIGPSGRRTGGVLGLTQHQANIVNNVRNDLLNLDKRYFTRTLRDKRYDAMVKQSIESGKPLPAATRKKIVGRYEDRMLKYRADTVARTETLASVNAAADEALRQVVDNGLAPRNAVVRVWHHSFAGNEREGHLRMNGARVGIDEPFVNPITGVPLMYPGDPSAGAAEVANCRCWVEHEIDFVAVENAA